MLFLVLQRIQDRSEQTLDARETRAAQLDISKFKGEDVEQTPNTVCHPSGLATTPQNTFRTNLRKGKGAIAKSMPFAQKKLLLLFQKFHVNREALSSGTVLWLITHDTDFAETSSVGHMLGLR